MKFNLSKVKIIKFLTVIGGVIILYLFVNLFTLVFSGYSTDWELHKKYMWIFKDSIIHDIDSIGYSYVGENDVFNNFHYKSDFENSDFGYNVVVWEFKNLNFFDLNSVQINNKNDLWNVGFKEGQTLDKGSDLETDVKRNFSFEKGMDINFDNYDSIFSYYKGLNYTGCFGKL